MIMHFSVIAGRHVKLTKKGYIRIWHGERQRMEHDLIWERFHNKTIPDGHCVHHIDFVKTNNNISNLQLVTHLDHKRIHSGCTIVDGVWHKPCRRCKESKPVNEANWYISQKTGWPYGWGCRQCHISIVVKARTEKRRQRREAKKHDRH